MYFVGPRLSKFIPCCGLVGKKGIYSPYNIFPYSLLRTGKSFYDVEDTL